MSSSLHSVRTESLKSILRTDFDHFLRLSHQAEGLALWRMWVNPRTLPVVLIRVTGVLERGSCGHLAAILRLIILWWFRIEIPCGVQIGPGLVLPHPGGIVIGSFKIGRNAIIFQNVTFGARAFDIKNDATTRPQIGDNVTVGAGAVVLGPVTVADGATIAANSLVIHDVPTAATALGVPATMKCPS